MMLEFITARKIKNLDSSELIDFIIDRVMDDKILLMEKTFTPEEKLDLLTKGLTNAQTKTSKGINMVQIPIETKTSGKLRSKTTQIQFNLFAPGTSQIDQQEDGHYCVKSWDGKIHATV